MGIESKYCDYFIFPLFGPKEGVLNYFSWYLCISPCFVFLTSLKVEEQTIFFKVLLLNPSWKAGDRTRVTWRRSSCGPSGINGRRGRVSSPQATEWRGSATAPSRGVAPPSIAPSSTSVTLLSSTRSQPISKPRTCPATGGHTNASSCTSTSRICTRLAPPWA